MTFRSIFHRRFVLPAALLLRGETSAYRNLARFRQLQFDRAGLEDLRKTRLDRILDHALATVPHYKGLGLPARPRLEDFPMLEKNDLVTHAEALRSELPMRSAAKTTGGSTGRAVTVWKNPEAIAAERAATWMAFEWYGIRPGDPAMRFWGSGGGRKRRFKAALADRAMNRETASAFAFSPSDLKAYWERLRRSDPVYLYGYVSMLEVMAQFVLDHGLESQGHSLRAVITTAEPLYPPQRDLIRKAFSVPVWNEYGCGEVGPIAYQCRDGGLHLMETHLWVEVVDEGGEPLRGSGTGEILVTDLTNLAMPLIRYRLRDTVTLGPPCSCGRALTSIQKVEGRSYDLLEDSRGRRYHGEAVMYIFEDLREAGFDILQFQVRQDQPGRARVLFVARERDQEAAQAIKRNFEERLGGMKVEALPVGGIDRAPSGKTRLIIRE
jgi:phenylacetate-CoA ligase